MIVSRFFWKSLKNSSEQPWYFFAIKCTEKNTKYKLQVIEYSLVLIFFKISVRFEKKIVLQ